MDEDFDIEICDVISCFIDPCLNGFYVFVLGGVFVDADEVGVHKVVEELCEDLFGFDLEFTGSGCGLCTFVKVIEVGEVKQVLWVGGHHFVDEDTDGGIGGIDSCR